MNELQIKLYSAEYKDAISHLIINIQRGEFGIAITLEQQPDLQTIPDIYQKGNGNFWVALMNGNVVGTIALIDIGQSQLALRKMFVVEKFRGKEFGIAQALLNTASAWMQKNNCSEVFLGTIDILKAAQRFYIKNGFEEISKENLPSNFPIMKVDDRFFRKRLKLNGQR